MADETITRQVSRSAGDRGADVLPDRLQRRGRFVPEEVLGSSYGTNQKTPGVLGYDPHRQSWSGTVTGVPQ